MKYNIMNEGIETCSSAGNFSLDGNGPVHCER